MRIVAFDYGHIRLGVALSDPSCLLARSLDYIDMRKGSVIKKIQELLKKYECKKIILGLPIALNGKETEKTKEVKKFKEKLEKHVVIPIEYCNEALTTYQANLILDNLNIKDFYKRREKKDSLSAQVLLQEYLDINR